MTTAIIQQPTREQLTKLRQCWHHMLQRCYDERASSYEYYGARGVTVCDEWRNDAKAFIAWSLANGFAVGLTIDRRENDKGYTPENCRWVTRAVNQQNRRKPSHGSQSKHIGVVRTKNGEKWQAFIQANGKRKYLGTFATEADAATAYDTAAVELYGPDAKVNFSTLTPPTKG